MVYEYYITMEWKNTDENKNTDSFEINTENINALVMYNDYTNSLMPILYAKLSLDKSNVDKMVKNAKTASVYLYIYKIKKTSGTETANTSTKVITQYSGEMSYFISKDINYNADIDYSEQNKEKKDVFETFSIGLMFKECIENNKQTNNTTFINTDPFNAILYFTSSTPTLIEKFTYNEPFKQLIVPPQDSLYKTIDFFNEVAVFYDTPYRFYLEPGCIYLMSSSGSAVPKNGEAYSSVIFNVHKVTDSDANTEGMTENSETESYYADINVKDTKYTIDNNTTKLFNAISTIIDPSKNNTVTLLSQVANTLSRIGNIVNEADSLINNSISNLKDVPSKIFDYNNTMDETTKRMDDTVKKALDSCKDGIDKLAKSGVSGIEDKVNDATKKYTDATALTDSVLGKISPLFKNVSDDIMGNIGYITNFSTFLNGITGININDNVNAALKTLTIVKGVLGSHDTKLNSELIPKVQAYQEIVGNVSSVLDIFDSIQSKVPGISGNVTDMKGFVQELSKDSDTITKIVTDYKSKVSFVKALQSSLEPTVKQFETFKIDVKSCITGVVTDVHGLGDTAKQSLDNIVKNAKTIADSVSQLDFSIDSLQDIQKDINIVKDISKIGRLGISSFTANLSVSGTSESGGTGTKVVRVSNDNVNMVKNIKATIENNANILVLNKNAMDTTVLTPNKQYVVKNYDAHSDKNGIFLLNKKTDIFLRHADVFSLNTRLELAKIKDQESSGTKETTAAKKVLNAKDWANIVLNAKNILDQSKNGITLDNIGDVIENAQKISDVFNKTNNTSNNNNK